MYPFPRRWRNDRLACPSAISLRGRPIVAHSTRLDERTDGRTDGQSGPLNLGRYGTAEGTPRKNVISPGALIQRITAADGKTLCAD